MKHITTKDLLYSQRTRRQGQSGFARRMYPTIHEYPALSYEISSTLDSPRSNQDSGACACQKAFPVSFHVSQFALLHQYAVHSTITHNESHIRHCTYTTRVSRDSQLRGYCTSTSCHLFLLWKALVGRQTTKDEEYCSQSTGCSLRSR